MAFCCAQRRKMEPWTTKRKKAAGLTASLERGMASAGERRLLGPWLLSDCGSRASRVCFSLSSGAALAICLSYLDCGQGAQLRACAVQSQQPGTGRHSSARNLLPFSTSLLTEMRRAGHETRSQALGQPSSATAFLILPSIMITYRRNSGPGILTTHTSEQGVA